MTGPTTVALAQPVLGRLPVDASCLRDLLPGLTLSGLGLGRAFVGATIAGTTGLGPADRGMASGVLHTAQRVGVAVGVAALVSAVAAEPAGPEALVSGYRTGLRLGALVAVAGAVIVVAVRRRPGVGADPESAPARSQRRPGVSAGPESAPAGPATGSLPAGRRRRPTR